MSMGCLYPSVGLLARVNAPQLALRSGFMSSLQHSLEQPENLSGFLCGRYIHPDKNTWITTI